MTAHASIDAILLPLSKGIAIRKGIEFRMGDVQNFENFMIFSVQSSSFRAQIFGDNIFSLRQNSAQGHNFG
jgi:hypothetical protein